MPNATIPFDFRPSQVVQTNGSYTIPANKYAHVTAWATDSYVSVDGNNWLTSKRIRDTINFNSPGVDQLAYTIEATGWYSIFFVSTPASAALLLRPWNTSTSVAWSDNPVNNSYLTFTSTNAGTIMDGNKRVLLHEGDQIRYGTGGVHNWRLNGVIEWENSSGSQWFPSGTILDGGNKIISLFDY